jgi:hypothetical protein
MSVFYKTPVYSIIQCGPHANEPSISLIILTPMKILQQNLKKKYVCCVRNEEECVPTRYMKNLFIQRRLVFGVGCPGGT